MAPPPGVDELTIAQALAPTPLTTCANGIRVPAEAEFVLEGRITHELVPEGPFVDLTGTYDFTRRQPVIEIDRVTHRRNAIYQALLPGKLEHRLLMGMPREPTIYAEVNKVACCLNVHVTPGGASWLHAVVQIAKRSPDDGAKAIAAAFHGHGSLKHVWVVDDDIDIFDAERRGVGRRHAFPGRPRPGGADAISRPARSTRRPTTSPARRAAPRRWGWTRRSGGYARGRAILRRTDG